MKKQGNEKKEREKLEKQLKKEQKKKSKPAEKELQRKFKQQCTVSSTSKEDDDDVCCPICVINYKDSSSLWVCCDKCDTWYNIECTSLKAVPDEFFCEFCN